MEENVKDSSIDNFQSLLQAIKKYSGANSKFIQKNLLHLLKSTYDPL